MSSAPSPLFCAPTLLKSFLISEDSTPALRPRAWAALWSCMHVSVQATLGLLRGTQGTLVSWRAPAVGDTEGEATHSLCGPRESWGILHGRVCQARHTAQRDPNGARRSRGHGTAKPGWRSQMAWGQGSRWTGLLQKSLCPCRMGPEADPWEVVGCPLEELGATGIWPPRGGLRQREPSRMEPRPSPRMECGGLCASHGGDGHPRCGARRRAGLREGVSRRRKHAGSGPWGSQVPRPGVEGSAQGRWGAFLSICLPGLLPAGLRLCRLSVRPRGTGAAAQTHPVLRSALVTQAHPGH